MEGWMREGVVAGLEPFIDTLCVCTITALVILLSGVWNRSPDAPFAPGQAPALIERGPGEWTLASGDLPARPGQPWRLGEEVFVVIRAGEHPQRGTALHRLAGVVAADGGGLRAEWDVHPSPVPPALSVPGVFAEYKGATLTARAFDRMIPGLGYLLVPAVAWLFALSTMISWSYYGEQGVVFLFGRRAAGAYRVVYCLLILVASSPLIRTETELDVISSLGTGVMLFANIPIMLVFGAEAMRAYRRYMRRLDAGELENPAASAG